METKNNKILKALYEYAIPTYEKHSWGYDEEPELSLQESNFEAVVEEIETIFELFDSNKYKIHINFAIVVGLTKGLLEGSIEHGNISEHLKNAYRDTLKEIDKIYKETDELL